MIGRAAIYALALVAAFGADGDRLAAQGVGADSASLRSRIERRFEVLPLREGVALRPRDTVRGVRLVELTGGTIAIDGQPATGAELRNRMGADADLILQLSYRGDAELRALFGSRDQPVSAQPSVPSPQPPDSPAAPTAQPDNTNPIPLSPGGRRDRRSRSGGGDRVRIGGSVTVERDEIVDGDVVAIGGGAHIDGEVRGDVVAVGGGLTLGPRASVSNNVVVVGGSLRRDPSARIGGEIQEIGIGSIDFGRWNRSANPFSIWRRSRARPAFAFVGALARLAILCLLAALVVLLGRDFMERAARRAAAEPVKAGTIGLLAELLLFPVFIITAAVLLITIVGIPMLILLPFLMLGLALMALVGFSGVAYRVGGYFGARLGWHPDNPYVTTLGGIVVLMLPTVLARLVGLTGIPLFPITGTLVFLGLTVEYLAWTVGFGAVALMRFSPPRPPFGETAAATAS
jgi:hypothetical protein